MKPLARHMSTLLILALAACGPAEDADPVPDVDSWCDRVIEYTTDCEAAEDPAQCRANGFDAMQAEYCIDIDENTKRCPMGVQFGNFGDLWPYASAFDVSDACLNGTWVQCEQAKVSCEAGFEVWVDANL